jgi:hypothetical protein
VALIWVGCDGWRSLTIWRSNYESQALGIIICRRALLAAGSLISFAIPGGFTYSPEPYAARRSDAGIQCAERHNLASLIVHTEKELATRQQLPSSTRRGKYRHPNIRPNENVRLRLAWSLTRFDNSARDIHATRDSASSTILVTAAQRGGLQRRPRLRLGSLWAPLIATPPKSLKRRAENDYREKTRRFAPKFH